MGTLLDDYDLTLSEIKSCIWMILNGVNHIHNCDVIHKDLSPSNILINDSGVIKISDFGNAWINNKSSDENDENDENDVNTESVECIENVGTR